MSKNKETKKLSKSYKKNRNKTKLKVNDKFAARESAKYDNPIPSREYIIDIIKKHSEPMGFKHIYSELGLQHHQDGKEALRRRINAMVRDKQLEKLVNGKYIPTGAKEIVHGTIVKEKKKLLFVPKNSEFKIPVSQILSESLQDGDKITAAISTTKPPTFLEVIEVTSQRKKIIIGRFYEDRGLYYVTPQNKDIKEDILIAPNKTKDAKHNDIVHIELLPSSGLKNRYHVGAVQKIVGNDKSPGIEAKTSIMTYGIPDEWSKSVLRQIKKFENYELKAKDRADRNDLSHLPFITIDGEDAKDFDDAVYCELNKNGGFKLYVAIADVSHYVKENSYLDKEACERGNSVYFPGNVVPMLPEVLSNELCSLKPNVERLVMVCEMRISKKGELTKYEFYEGIITSHARTTYNEIADILHNQSEKLINKYQNIIPHIVNLHEVYKVLNKSRQLRGAIEFETVETRALFNNKRKIKKIIPVYRNVAHKMIEECMLAANVATAKFLKKHEIPGIYRNHEKPPEDKLTEFRNMLQQVGIKFTKSSPKPIDFNDLISSISERSDAKVIKNLILRTMSQAVYSPDNIGHFGLAYKAYTHFTSPIRRYPDLLVHRQIKKIIHGEWKTKQHKPDEDHINAIKEIAMHCSMTERRADEAVRDTMRWLKCEYMQKFIGMDFDAIIVSVTRFGFFAEIENIFIDGLVHISSIKSDYYIFDQAHQTLIGEKTKRKFSVGDKVRVTIAKVDLDEKRIDFELKYER